MANRGMEDGRRQERLKNAIEHLGHDSDLIRLGGAYELFDLARDTEDLRRTALDMLCAYIRRATGESEYRKRYKDKPSEEIQSLLTMLFVQDHEFLENLYVNLQGSWLNGAVLRGARLEKANLAQSHLQKANLCEARMQEVNLSGAHLQGTYLVDPYLQRADLSGAHLQGSVLLGAHLQGADLRRAHLQGVAFSRPYLQGANLRGVHLQGAGLHGARLQRASLVEAHMQGANLPRALLQGANLRGANLQGAYLFEADLHEATLLETHLQGATCDFIEGSSFATRIRAGIGREGNFSEATFAGGLSRGDVDALVEGLPSEQAEALRRTLEPHIGKPPSHEPPRNSGVIVGAYTEEEAERWVAEYEEAMRGVPRAKSE